MPRHQAQMLPFKLVDRRIHRPAHAGGVLDDGLHDRLEIGGRARNDSQDLGRGGLLLERLSHLPVSLRERTVFFLQLREQPDVFDGDHRLGGEGLQQRDLPVGERADLDPTDGNRANHPSISNHWYADRTAETKGLAKRLTILRVSLRVWYVHNPSLEDDATVNA